jgi:hypothetical protein
MDKFDNTAESEESDSDSSSSSTFSDKLSDSQAGQRSNRGPPTSHKHLQSAPSYLTCGVSRKHPPIHTYLVQICIIANHAVGKDTHVRGIKIFGPATAESREKAKRDAKKSKESRRVTGTRAIRQRTEKELKRKRRAIEGLRRWVQEEGGEEGSESEEEGQDQSTQRPLGPHIPTSRTLELLSTLR